MGAIFQGRDLDLGRDLAVKVIREEHRDHPEMVRRFVEEAQIGGQLQHPGIVPVHELGRLPDGRMFIAMKLVRGRTLAALLAARRSPDEDRTRFLVDLRAGLPDRWPTPMSKGVIHRDLKPSNIMVGSFGEVQVMDWGLAKVLDQGGVADEERAVLAGDDIRHLDLASGSEAMESRPGSVLGTPSYMAPEQARGDGHARRAGGRLRPRLDPLRDPDRPAGVRGRSRSRGVPQGGEGRPLRCVRTTRRLRRRRGAGGPGPGVPGRRAEASAPGRGDGRAGLTAYLRGVEGRLREAELAQARAETRAAGERRRRRLTLALAASVLDTG